MVPIRSVALDKDVRAHRLLPTRQRVLSRHFVRRSLSVLTLASIDVGALLVSLLLESVVTDTRALELWPGLTPWGVAAAGLVVVVVAAFAGLYGTRRSRHHLRKVLTAWSVGFVITSVVLLAVDAGGLGARLVAVFLAAFVLSAAGRWVFDALLALTYGQDADCPRVLVLGDIDACARALATLSALPPDRRVNVVGLVLPAGRREEAAGRTGGTPPLVGTQEDIKDALRQCGASEVVIADLPSLNGQLRPLMDACRDAGVALKVVTSDLALEGAAVAHIPGMECPVFVIRPQPAGWASYLAKRVVDRVGAAVLLLSLIHI